MKNLSNIKEKLLVEQVEEMLYKLIKEEPYPKGTKLPNEFKLGEHFGVSRSTVREAIRSLTSKGVLEVRRGSEPMLSIQCFQKMIRWELRNLKIKKQLLWTL